MVRLRFAILLSLAALVPALPASAQPASPPPPLQIQPGPPQPSDKFGEEIALPGKPIIYIVGAAKWDSAFESLVDSFRSLKAYLDKEGVAISGPAMTIYTETDDAGFKYRAAFPVAEPPKNPPKGDIAAGKSPEGKALKFVHRGSYDAMDVTYEAITNHLDEKRLEAQDLFVEEYVTDILTTPADKLVVNVYVPIK
jgi:effector-binding domain-containing protein